MINVIVNGASGKMGRHVVDAINDAPDLHLNVGLGRNDNLDQAIKTHQPDVVVDFTVANAGAENALTILNAGARAVMGTSGFTKNNTNAIATLCEEKKLGAIIGPNFSISALMMMEFAAIAAKQCDMATIIERHHTTKKDAPSGTAKKSAELMRAANPTIHIDIQSERLPHTFAEQDIVFDFGGETLSINAHSTDRKAYMPGVLKAIRDVMMSEQLTWFKG